jgi:hypothetical protein
MSEAEEQLQEWRKMRGTESYRVIDEDPDHSFFEGLSGPSSCGPILLMLGS